MKLLALLFAALFLAFSAPRSAPEPVGDPTGSVPAMSASDRGIAAASQGRTGVPTTEHAGAHPERASDGLPVGRQVGAPLFARTGIGTAAGSLKAVASYYGTGPAGVAAAGPTLRAALGSDWRGTWVRVTYAFTEMDSRGRVRHRSRSAWLRLGDSCWCAVADIDIPTRTFSYLSHGELWRGLLRVTITWGDVPRLPATSTEEGWKP